MRLDVKGQGTFVATAGPAPDVAAEVVVLIHGAGMAAAIWPAQLQALATAERAVLAPTLPGHGAPGTSQASEGPPPASIEAAARWLVDLLDALKVPRAALVGHSMGALVALEAARRYPERVRALALLGAALEMKVHPALLAAAREEPAKAAEQILGWGFAARQGERPPGLSLTAIGRRMLLASAAGVLASDLAACAGWQAGDLGNVPQPALVLIGARDRMTPPRAGLALAKALPHAQAVELTLSGHMMMVEQPRAVVRAIRCRLDRFSASAAGERESVPPAPRTAP